MGNRLLHAVIMLMALPTGMSAQNDSLSFKERYEAFRKKAQREYTDFRTKANNDYADFMEKAWKDYPIEDAVDRPKEDDIKPIEYDKMSDEDYIEDMKRQEAEKKLAEEQKKREEESEQNGILNALRKGQIANYVIKGFETVGQISQINSNSLLSN